ncbi:MAG: undecaprenyldiphospho-muramoylpentapeptide beta-N-acetylglucosaminyltransferase [Nitrospinae bacterium]|jgi:UDP-N-acetylglucosamine--N-acetylmuramyl-(pentapeptide) pyrophosphoryl-undecaprenol N-acetylglucosamine transferase|nr:undecaprenyldiphospho-muramoylpentapeptide beta-N-acetylglucosaminyltransferase [Nitrospinota bacterium]MDA1109798.1 undecaprenyldiphospho-muramoylpentapeptide beta-N-acetylglucosaminyltransferase [Nitrospinota bacterium]
MRKRVVIAGGGTGGHLYPGIALAKALKKHDNDMDITFVGTRQGIESKILPREGWPLKTIYSGGLLGKKGFNRLLAWVKIPVGILQSFTFLLQKRPGLVVGVGGYVSGPLVLSAWILRIPILIQEQNAVPGITNKWLGKIADKIAVSFKESKKYFPENKVVETGNLIREEFCVLRENSSPLPSGKFNILVLGGSQGAHSINRGMVEAIDFLSEKKDRFHITHQTGERDCDWVKSQYAEKNISADVQAFIHDMAEQYRKASLIICRAGASTLGEITACGKMAVLIPYPHATHNHQEHNARVLEAAGAGEIMLDKDVSGERLAQSILQASEQPEKRLKMENNCYALGKRDATEKALHLCLELLNKSRGKSGRNETTAGENVLSCF